MPERADKILPCPVGAREVDVAAKEVRRARLYLDEVRRTLPDDRWVTLDSIKDLGVFCPDVIETCSKVSLIDGFQLATRRGAPTVTGPP